MLKESLKLWQETLLKRPLMWGAFFFLGQASTLFLEQSQNQTDPQNLIVAVIAVLVVALISMWVGACLIAEVFVERNWTEIWQKQWVVLVSEHFRYFGSVLLWGVFFILPGIYRMLRLSLFVPAILLNPNFDPEKDDALKISVNLTKDEIPKLLAIFFGLLLPSLLLEGFQDAIYNHLGLEARLVVGAASFLLNLYASIVFFFLYQEKSR